MREISLPSPLWGSVDRIPRSSPAGGGPGEGVKLVKTQYRYRRTRSRARTAGQLNEARELRQTLAAPDLFVQKVLSFVLLTQAAVG